MQGPYVSAVGAFCFFSLSFLLVQSSELKARKQNFTKQKDFSTKVNVLVNRMRNVIFACHCSKCHSADVICRVTFFSGRGWQRKGQLGWWTGRNKKDCSKMHGPFSLLPKTKHRQTGEGQELKALIVANLKPHTTICFVWLIRPTKTFMSPQLIPVLLRCLADTRLTATTFYLYSP